MRYGSCIMGCTSEIGKYTHDFPKDPKRRAEWSRILGVYPRVKNVFICSAHFSDYYIYGRKLSKYAVPNPPVSRESIRQIEVNSTYSKEPQCQTKLFPEIQIMFKERKKDAENIDEMKKIKTEKSEETVGKVESFEIRKGSTSDMIIKGRFVQTNDHLIVSYTPPRKWSLQQQVKLLDEKCTQQLKRNNQLNKENVRLFNELKKYQKLLPKFRYLQSTNRFLYGLLKLKRQQRKKSKIEKTEETGRC